MPSLRQNVYLLPFLIGCSTREKDILSRFCRGLSYKQIAEADGISRSTVRNSIDRIQDKAGVGSKQELVIWAMQTGLLDGLEPSD